MEVIERNMELLKLQKNYEDAELRNHENAEEIAKLKEQCRALSDELNNYKQESCGKCEENLLVIENLERGRNKLALEKEDLSDSAKVIEEEYKKYKKQMKQLEQIKKNLEIENKICRDHEHHSEKSRNMYKKYNKRYWALWFDLFGDHERLLRILQNKTENNNGLKAKREHLRYMIAESEKELEEVQKQSLNDMKSINDRFLQKKTDFKTQRNLYLDEIKNLQKELEEEKIKHF